MRFGAKRNDGVNVGVKPVRPGRHFGGRAARQGQVGPGGRTRFHDGVTEWIIRRVVIVARDP